MHERDGRHQSGSQGEEAAAIVSLEPVTLSRTRRQSTAADAVQPLSRLTDLSVGGQAPRPCQGPRVYLSRLAVFAAGEVVSPEALVEKGIIKKADERVKILASGELSQPLTIKAHGFSAAAAAKIEAAGGTVEVIA